MKIKHIVVLCACLFGLDAAAQVVGVDGKQIDTTNIYGERSDSLNATVFVSRQSTLPKGKDIRTEVITAAGLCKMACCNLAESFENSASVTVGYSDAVTGARQIRLLGLSGTYTQMLDENRPVMRGLHAPFGLSYVPGQWLESIQIAKGVSSVINGVEGMTGQINMEHRKPTDEKPLFINVAAMNDTKMDFNIASSLQFNDSWSTVFLGHVSGNLMAMDMNKDGFMDDPKMLQFNFSNRWLYFDPDGLQVRFGVRAIRDSRIGGQMLEDEKGEKHIFDHNNAYDFINESSASNVWGSNILNRSIDTYVKVGYPLDEDGCTSIALVADYNYQDSDMYFGKTSYLGGQHSGFMNLLYQGEINEDNKFTVGLSGMADLYDESLARYVLTGSKSKFEHNGKTSLANAGAFGEYTFHSGDVFSAIMGLRADWYNAIGKVKVSPRLTLKYTPHKSIVLRANGGRGLRYSTPLIDNIGVFSTGKPFYAPVKGESFTDHILEDAWTLGANGTYYFPGDLGAYISFDYFHTMFNQQMIVDYEFMPNTISFYASNGSKSFTDNYQADFSIEPFRGFTVTTTFRYTNAMMSLLTPVAVDGIDASHSALRMIEKPMTSRFKGVLNLQYATNLNKWIFDFTASANGPSRLYDFMATQDWVNASEGQLYLKDSHAYSKTYPLLYCQVTRRFKGIDIYVGGENLTNFTQKNVIFGDKASNGFVNASAQNFDASCIWGPLMGVKLYAGLRLTIWKTE